MLVLIIKIAYLLNDINNLCLVKWYLIINKLKETKLKYIFHQIQKAQIKIIETNE